MYHAVARSAHLNSQVAIPNAQPMRNIANGALLSVQQSPVELHILDMIPHLPSAPSMQNGFQAHRWTASDFSGLDASVSGRLLHAWSKDLQGPVNQPSSI
jgi:hypothetical protein